LHDFKLQNFYREYVVPYRIIILSEIFFYDVYVVSYRIIILRKIFATPHT